MLLYEVDMERQRTVPAAPGRILRRIVLGLSLIALALYALWSVTGERRAIRRLGPEERSALYQSTLQAVRTACSNTDPSLDDYCRAQARILLALPECDAACHQLADDQLHRER